ncbi:MAG TPA: hypothetical protein VEX86_18885, partial [Longimicrobium sp.]|nr:hypothetical protein [Longimicrobium sp.]
QGHPQPQPAYAPAYPPPMPEAAPVMPPVRTAGPVRRFFRALWEFTVTSAALAMFVGAWWLAVAGAVENRGGWFYAGLAATMLCTPFALHRLTGRRGRLGFGIVASIAATALAWRLTGRSDLDPAISLAAVFGLQVLACFTMSWLTRRRIKHRPAAA